MLTRAEIPGLVCTALLIALGLFLAIWHWKSWKQVAAHPELATPGRWSQCRIRLQVAALIAVEGLLLCAGDTVLPVLQRVRWITPRQMAVLWAIDVLAMLGAAIWLALLALGDMAVSIAHNRMERLRTRQQERSLCEEIERFREMREDPNN